MTIKREFRLSRAEVQQAIAEYIANAPTSSGCGVPSNKGHRDYWTFTNFREYVFD